MLWLSKWRMTSTLTLVCAHTAMRMELWTAGMAALTILPRLALASVAVVYLMLTREWVLAQCCCAWPWHKCSCLNLNVVCTHSDEDGVMDCWDGCVDDPAKTVSGICGCGVPDTDT